MQHVHVRVGACDIAIPIDQVWQALPLPEQGLTVLPRRSGGLLGVADVAGATVPIVALERWLPMGSEGESAASQRLLVLRNVTGLVGIRVDAVLGVKNVPLGELRKVHQMSDQNELFESVIPASGAAPALCILEVARLMVLSQVWCEAAELSSSAPAAPGRLPEVKEPPSSTRRYAVFLIGKERWAVPVDAVQRVVPLPAIELALGPAQRSWAISQWQGRKLPLVDLSADRQSNDRQSVPWMVLVCRDDLILGLSVSACEQFVNLAPDRLASTPDDILLAGVSMLPELGRLQVLDVTKLFHAIPEASISRMSLSDTDTQSGATSPGASEPYPYLVFDADQRYASPVDGIVGVVGLPPEAQEVLRQGQRALLVWRGHTVHVINLPSIAKSKVASAPQLAVLVQVAGSSSPPIGIAIRSLCDWLPAHSARRSGMRMGEMGELGLINAKGAMDHSNLVVVDLAQMAYLLG